MNELKRSPGFPWHFWTIFFVVTLLLCFTYRFFPPSFQLSPVQLSSKSTSCTAEFDATNHARTRATRTLRVTVFLFRPGTKARRPIYIPLDHRDISVALAPSETKHIRCDFPQTGDATPNQAEVEIISDSPIPK